MSGRGFTYKEVLLALAVLAVGAAILVPIAMVLQGRRQEETDVERMRSLYIAMAMYEQDQNGQLPPDLLVARDYTQDDRVLLSVRDPFVSAQASAFPVDAGLPNWRVESPVRISYAYLYAFVQAGQATTEPWEQLKFNPAVGLLASEWQGGVDAGQNFQANVRGTLYRINTDGALYSYDRGGPKPLGDPQDLFFRR
jgi:type II secretory pathway pseudopilin PulG